MLAGLRETSIQRGHRVYRLIGHCPTGETGPEKFLPLPNVNECPTTSGKLPAWWVIAFASSDRVSELYGMFGHWTETDEHCT